MKMLRFIGAVCAITCALLLAIASRVVATIGAVLFVILLPGLANAADAGLAIDFGPVVQQVVVPTVVAVLGAVGTWALVKFKTWLGIKESSQQATTLDAALQNALAYAQSRLPGVVATMPLSIATKNEVVDLAAKYALAHVPDTLKALGVDETLLLQKLEARLSINTTSAEKSIAVPNAPVVAPIGSPPVLSGPNSKAG